MEDHAREDEERVKDGGNRDGVGTLFGMAAGSKRNSRFDIISKKKLGKQTVR